MISVCGVESCACRLTCVLAHSCAESAVHCPIAQLQQQSGADGVHLSQDHLSLVCTLVYISVGQTRLFDRIWVTRLSLESSARRGTCQSRVTLYAKRHACWPLAHITSSSYKLFVGRFVAFVACSSPQPPGYCFFVQGSAYRYDRRDETVLMVISKKAYLCCSEC
jgi:hypothetical protein